MFTRRQVLKAGSVAGAAAFAPIPLLTSSRKAWAQPVPGGSLDPTTIPKYVTPLYKTPAFPKIGRTADVDIWSIAGRMIRQQMLPHGFPKTMALALGAVNDPRSFRAPGWSFETKVDRFARVTWANQFVDRRGDFLPHFLTIDPTLHWANPPGGIEGRDTRPTFTSTPPPYKGPIPMVIHLHGTHDFQESDGYPENWFLPVARNIPAGYATVGGKWDKYKQEALDRWGVHWQPGNMISQYPNDQRATMLWYHNHELGMTRLNMYAGLAGTYMLRGGVGDLPPGILPGPAPGECDLPGTRYYEIPLFFQDKSFNADGGLFFPDTRGTFGDVPPNGPWIPDTDVPPYWNPEFFANTVVINGNTWPTMTVEPRRYRFRLVNGCNARTFVFKIVADPLAPRPATPAMPLHIIGADGGFLPKPVSVDSAWLMVCERLDIIMDFTGMREGTELYLINEGPDEPFTGEGGPEQAPTDPGTTGQCMRFVVGPLRSRDTSVPVDQLQLPAPMVIGEPTFTRPLSLNEIDSTFFPDAPIRATLGVFNPDGTPKPLGWVDPITEFLASNSTEEWQLNNFTEDGHPIHVHLVQFQILGRQPIGGGPIQPPMPWETGRKDVVLAPPGMRTSLKAYFDNDGLFVWHCHILDHEDNDMMRPFQVGTPY